MKRRRLGGSWDQRIQRNIYNLNSFCLDWIQLTAGGMPIIQPTQTIPDGLFPYDERDKYRGESRQAVHFYCEDIEFESCWLRANRWPHMPAIVQKIGTSLTPDFSLYTDHPYPIQVWNAYRGKLLGALWQYQGIDVIPTATWSTPDSYDWAFDGLPVGGVVSISTGNIYSDDERHLFGQGFREMIRRLNPSTVLVYGRGFCGELEGLANVRRYDARRSEINKRRKHHEGQQTIPDLKAV